MKRGLKPPPRGMTLGEIAVVEHCSVDTVVRTLNRAVSKLKRAEPQAFELILAAVQACAHEPLKAGSLECESEWIEKNWVTRADVRGMQNYARYYSSYRTPGRAAPPVPR